MVKVNFNWFVYVLRRFRGKSEFVLGFSKFLNQTLRNTPSIAKVMEPPITIIVDT